jgi:rhodanese-related sulfurtransferase
MQRNVQLLKTNFPNSFLRLLIILITSVLVTIVVDLLLPSSLPLILSFGKRPGISKTDRNEMKYTDVNIAFNEFSKGNCLLVDVRDRTEFTKLHPAKSINLPYHGSEDIYTKFSEKISVEKKIFILCEGTICSMSVRIANRLSELGYKNTVIIKQDFEDWKRLKLPTERSAGESDNDF